MAASAAAPVAGGNAPAFGVQGERAVIPRLGSRPVFPSLATALADPNGLLAFGGDLSVPRLVAAYRRGIFPWYSDGQPILWWSPDPRMVLPVADFRVTRSLRKRVQAGTYETRLDTAFDAVIRACAETPRDGQAGTWITEAMIAAYGELHRCGYAHSVESWRDGRLVGGLYGIALGRMFFGESMFAHATDASKVALVALVGKLREQGVPLIDCQQETAHLATFGARPIPRERFAARLAELIHSADPPPGWRDAAPAPAGPPTPPGSR